MPSQQIEAQNCWEQMPLMEEFRRVRGGEECELVLRYADAIFRHMLTKDNRIPRNSAMLAEAMHYVCRGGIESYLRQLRDQELSHSGHGELVLRDGLWRLSSMSTYYYMLNQKSRWRIENIQKYLGASQQSDETRLCVLNRKCGFCNWITDSQWKDKS